MKDAGICHGGVEALSRHQLLETTKLRGLVHHDLLTVPAIDL